MLFFSKISRTFVFINNLISDKMNFTRRKFFKQSLAGALMLGATPMLHAAQAMPIRQKAAKSSNPFQLGMAGYTFVKTLFVTQFAHQRDVADNEVVLPKKCELVNRAYRS